MLESYVLYKKKLEGQYLETFDKIELYSITRSLDINTHEELMMDLIDVFLTAQKNGKSVKNIVGNDVGSFCRNFCSGIGLKNQIKGFADSFKRITWLILIFCIIDLFSLFEGVSYFEIQSNIMPILAGGLIGIILSFVFGAIFKTLMFRFKKINMKIYSIGLFICVIIFTGSFIFATNKLSINVFNWEIILASGVYLIAYYILRKVYFQKLMKPQKIRFSDMVIEEIQKSWHKIITNKNKRLLKKGKEPLTSLEFTKSMQKKHRFDEWIVLVGWSIFIAIYLGFGIKVGLESKLFDTVMFMIIVGVVYIPIAFFIRSSTRSIIWQKKTLDICVQEKIDIFTYIENKKIETENNDFVEVAGD